MRSIFQKRGRWGTTLFLGCSLFAGELTASNVVVQSFSPPGLLSFQNNTNSVIYQIQWASSLTGSWQHLSQLISLDAIPQTTQSQFVVPVPAFYRVQGFAIATNMALIPAGSFLMGHPTNVFPSWEGDSFDETPQHTVNLRPFLIERTEVSAALWSNVYAWAVTNGYEFDNSGDWKSNTHPVVLVSWYDAVKWCNARSEREGLVPAYYTNKTLTDVYRSGSLDLDASMVNWMSGGYRLPTEAEWEYAALGGHAFIRFPWSDYTNNISHEKANYKGNGSGFDLSSGYHPAYSGFFEPTPYTAPTTSLGTNGYGLFHMAGNVSEWCWDWYQPGYYAQSPTNNPRGPDPSLSRVVRGGNWDASGYEARNANRQSVFPGSANYSIGFRCVIGL